MIARPDTATSSYSPELQQALDFVSQEKAGIVPPFLTDAELTELLEAWHRLWNDPTIVNANTRFIVDYKLYREPAFTRLATHPVVQDIARRVIGDFQLAGYSVVATPKNSTEVTTPETTRFHIDHCVYSHVAVEKSRDTFVCIWVNFEKLDMENGPFALAVGTDRWSIGYDFFKEREHTGLRLAHMNIRHMAAYNVGPAGMTAVYSGKTWHAGTNNCSDVVRKGLNMNFVPRHPLDSLKRNPFDVCGLPKTDYDNLVKLIGDSDYVIPWDAEMAQLAASKAEISGQRP